MMTMLLVLAVLAAMVGGAVLAVGRFRVDDESSGGAVSVVVAPCVLALYLAAAAMGVVIGWENFTGAGDGITEETGAADALYWSTTTLPADEAETVRQQLRAYMSAVADSDWPMMRAEGELSEEGDEALAELAASVRALSVSDSGDGLDRLTARQELAELSDARIERADAAGDGIPFVLNGIAALSAVAVAVLPFAMIRRGSTVAYFWASANLVFVFATILLLFYLGNPYNGALAHDAGAIQDALAGFERIDASLSPQ
ncbi:DUF4239 domain-containing protein [Nocardiopsis akebiae]|uniref:DUF4239 domain-containing protein n=1 Tax=Nocardiopsis akebiae TaxID=2831968 RepID=A0ABX8C600_9ACTN|nr:DUF4239 domain-containing protein [Nocardiopsis akebiae]QUX29850.1 DUF4239 domain-containing protein [Nocardiopsis akebiae]